MSRAVVSARGVRKRFDGREVICGVDFDIRPGICFGILGPNGAGKTTLIRMLLGMSPVSGGDYTLFGRPAGDREVRARLGVVPQMDNLDPDFTVRQNLIVYARYFGLSPRQAEPRAEELLSFAELSQRGDSPVSSLSGGMKRRLLIARSLINDPDLVMLDEPTTGLDPQARHLIWQRLRELKRRGKTLVLTTHYMEEAEQLCDELMVLEHGRILARGSPAQLKQAHVEPEVVELRAGISDAGVEELCRGLDIRREHVGDTWFCYGQDSRLLVSRCADVPGLIFVHRPTNLEDVFLRLTGRELRD